MRTHSTTYKVHQLITAPTCPERRTRIMIAYMQPTDPNLILHLSLQQLKHKLEYLLQEEKQELFHTQCIKHPLKISNIDHMISHVSALNQITKNRLIIQNCQHFDELKNVTIVLKCNNFICQCKLSFNGKNNGQINTVLYKSHTRE